MKYKEKGKINTTDSLEMDFQNQWNGFGKIGFSARW